VGRRIIDVTRVAIHRKDMIGWVSQVCTFYKVIKDTPKAGVFMEYDLRVSIVAEHNCVYFSVYDMGVGSRQC
jgi:hypothetical protein